MLDIKTSAVVLALLGVVVYESTSHSASTAKLEEQIETLHDRIRLLSEAQATTHDSIMLETSTRKEEVGQLKTQAVDPAQLLKA
jgi:23S rRNA maturation mini-RNase III